MKKAGKILKWFVAGIFLSIVVIVLLFGYRDIPLEELKAKYATGASSFVSMDEMDVHFRDEGNSGDSIPIVLIHGTGASLHTFDDWTARLKGNHRVIRMDLPGYGLTGPFPHRDYSIAQYVNFIKHFLEKIGVEQCIIGGNSLGGNIAWRFTSAHPEMVTKLILIDATGYPLEAKSVPIAFKLAATPVFKEAITYITPKFIARSSVENVYADKSKVTDALAMRYFELTLRPGNRQAFIDRFAAVREKEAYRQIADISQPTLILWGAQDLLVPVQYAEQFHEDLPNDTLVILDNSGHVPMEESPSRSVEAVIAFLK